MRKPTPTPSSTIAAQAPDTLDTHRHTAVRNPPNTHKTQRSASAHTYAEAPAHRKQISLLSQAITQPDRTGGHRRRPDPE